MTRGIRGIVWPCLLAALAIGVRAQAADDPVHFCQDDEGNVVTQQAPCDDGTIRKGARGERAAAPPPRQTRREQRAALRIVRPAAPLPPRRRPVVPGPVDPRFGSPEATWRTFTAAVQRRDRAEILECLTASAAEEMGLNDPAHRLESIREAVESVTRIESDGDLGPFWSLRAHHGHGRPTWVFLEQSPDGTWRIAAL